MSKRENTFALLHATRGDYKRALEVRDIWVNQAYNPELIQHIFGFSDDDKGSLPLKDLCGSKKFDYVCIPNNQKIGGTAVDNWNATLEKANAYYYFVIADDLTPPKNWDKDIWEAARFAYNSLSVISVDDASDIRFEMKRKGEINEKKLQEFTLLPRHPIVSWKWIEEKGHVFHPSYSGLFCDNDIHAEAMYLNAFIFLPHIKLTHKDIKEQEQRKDNTNADILYSKKSWALSQENFIKRLGELEKTYKRTPY